MRKLLPLLLIVVVFGVFMLSSGNASAQPSDEMQKQMQLVQTLTQGAMSGPNLIWFADKERMGISDEQLRSYSVKMREAIRPLQEEIEKKVGNPDGLRQEEIGDVAESVSTLMPKMNEIYRTAMNETFTAETIKRIDTVTFQRYGGVFGGAMNIENLAVMNLSAEQKEKIAKIDEQFNRERFELIFSLRVGDVHDHEEKIREITDKIISLTRRGQREIEALLTPEQEKLAEKLMADVPEQHRFLNDFLKNRPWRLDESRWQPGDGAPPNLENYPGEMRPERKPGERTFPGN